MTLELNRLVQAAEEMGQVLASRQQDLGGLVEQARVWLSEFADPGAAVADAAPSCRAAIPTHEPLDHSASLPELPLKFTVIGADGSFIQPDRHGMALYYLINIGSLTYRHGSGETPEPRSIPSLGYQGEDLYEGLRLVNGNLLDVRRDQAELEHLADMVEAEPGGPTLALVDGTLLLWVLDDLPATGKEQKIEAYLAQLTRIRDKGAAVAAFTSRPRSTEVGNLLHLALCAGDANRAQSEPNPLDRLPDRAIFFFLEPGGRSAIFESSHPTSRSAYAHLNHHVHFFYVNVADEGEKPVIARVEAPAWVVKDQDLLDFVHGGVVAQSRIAGGFPYVLVRADEQAFISGPEREQLEEMVTNALYRAGLIPELSPKASYKGMTRQRRRS